MCREPMSQPDAGDNSKNKKCPLIFIIADDNLTCVYTSGTDTVSYPMRAPNRRRISESSIRSVWTMWSDVMRPSFRARLMMFVAQTKGIQYLFWNFYWISDQITKNMFENNEFNLTLSDFKVKKVNLTTVFHQKKHASRIWSYVNNSNATRVLLLVEDCSQKRLKNKLKIIKVKNSISIIFSLTSTSDFFDPLFRRFSAHFPASDPSQRDAVSQEIVVWHEGKFVGELSHRLTPCIAWCFAALVYQFLVA